jgi:mono/diheme cytochrome c family protein
MVEQGQYLATVGNCISCHTRPGGAPFSGGRPFATSLGTLYSSNITSDPGTGIGKWSVTDLRRAMHEGIAADGYRLFPAFPYPAFTKVSIRDIDAIYSYLRTLAPVHYSPPANDFVFTQRWGLAVWNELFFKGGRFEADPKQSTQWNRGAYLVEGLGHCSVCHSPRNSFLAEVPSRKYSGGHFENEVATGNARSWSGVNLTSARSGLAAWTKTQLEQYLKSGFSTRAGTFGPMNEVIINSSRYLTREDVSAMALYLKSLPPIVLVGAQVSPDSVKAGAALYEEHCAECHLASGRGGMFTGPPLAGSAVVQAEGPESLINIILYGAQPPEEISLGSWETMKPYKDVLSDTDIADVSNFVRGSWGNEAPMVAPRDVAAQR